MWRRQKVNVEKKAYALGYRLPVGVDEAGRGPLAGPVVAAACFLAPTCRIRDIRDSKALSALQREKVAKALLGSKQVKRGLGIASQEEIDAINILQATLLAMRRAVAALPERPDFLFIDGNVALEIDIAVETVVGGDRYVRSISAASILAKVTRDQLMREMHTLYPEYGFDQHKGYGTKHHFAMLAKYGPCPLHRKSFLVQRPVCAT